VVSRLKDAICQLKQEVLDHVKNGCQGSILQNSISAKKFSDKYSSSLTGQIMYTKEPTDIN
jgi:hypothetical protein